MSEGSVVPMIVGGCAPAFIPVIHMLLTNHIWGQYTRIVNRTECRCGCWDTFFKGSYELGIGRYKHIYFNATSNTLKIWLCTVVAIILMYECMCRIVRLWQTRSIRFSMLILFGSSVYSHYYAWWSFFNYWNDDFYSQWYHQLLFTFTEGASTAIVVSLLDTKNDVEPWKLVIIVSIAMSHFVTSMSDQFAANVLNSEGQLHQVLRDVGFMYSDIFHICIPLWEWRTLVKKFRLPPTYLQTKSQTYLLTKLMMVTGVSIVLSVWAISTFL